MENNDCTSLTNDYCSTFATVINQVEGDCFAARERLDSRGDVDAIVEIQHRNRQVILFVVLRPITIREVDLVVSENCAADGLHVEVEAGVPGGDLQTAALKSEDGHKGSAVLDRVFLGHCSALRENLDVGLVRGVRPFDEKVGLAATSFQREGLFRGYGHTFALISAYTQTE